MSQSALPFAVEERQSLRRRTTVALGVVVLLTVLFETFGVVGFVYRTEQNAWQNRQLEVAHNAAGTVEVFLRHVRQDMTLVGLLDRRYLETHPQIIADLLDQNRALLEVVRLDDAGDVLASAYRESAPVLANQFTLTQSSWFLQAREGQRYTGDVQISAEDEPYLILSQPVADGGVVAARLRIDVLWDAVARIRFGRTGQAYVVDRAGYVVAHPEREIVLARTNVSGEAEMAPALEAVGQSWRGTYHNFQGVKVMGIKMPIAGSDWVILIEIPEHEALSTTRRALMLLGGGTVLLGLLLGLASDRLLRRLILRRVSKLRDGVERVGKGDLDHRLEVQHMDEIGQVAAAFNVMAGRLQERETALAQARDEALAASRFKSRILANVSHDLRTPLNGVLGYADMLQEGVYGPLNERQQTAEARVLAHARHLVSLIDSLLDQALLEDDKLELSRLPFRPASVLDEVEAIMGVMAQKKGLTLVTEVDPALPDTLTGDPRRLRQIMVNLVENAVKFTDQGQVRVRLYPEAARWVIEVADTGRGIPAAAQAIIFDAFQQVDGSTTREKRGVGLGLSIVRQLTALMGGEIHLASQVGHGSTFKVSLPLLAEGEKIT